jgi:hypothetical protein
MVPLLLPHLLAVAPKTLLQLWLALPQPGAQAVLAQQKPLGPLLMPLAASLWKLAVLPEVALAEAVTQLLRMLAQAAARAVLLQEALAALISPELAEQRPHRP